MPRRARGGARLLARVRGVLAGARRSPRCAANCQRREPRRLWKSLGTRRGQAVRFAKFYAQKFSLGARKLLVPKGDSAIICHGSRERRPLRSGAGGPSGGGSTARDQRGCALARRIGGLSGRCGQRVTARAASRRAFPRLAPLTGRRQPPAQAAVAAPDRKRVPRNAASGWRAVRREGEARRAEPVTGLAHRRKAASRPDAASGGGKPIRSSSRGAGSGSLRGVSGAREGALAPLAFCRSSYVGQQCSCAQRGMSAQ